MTVREGRKGHLDIPDARYCGGHFYRVSKTGESRKCLQTVLEKVGKG